MRLLLLGDDALVKRRSGLSSSNFPVDDLSVGLSSALWKNGTSDPDAVWHHRLDRSRDEAGSVVGDQSTGRGTSGANLRRAIYNQRGLYSVRVRQCLNRGSCGLGSCVCGSRHCCIRWESMSCKRKGFCSPFSQWEMPLHCRRWNVSDSYAKTSHFHSANISLESLIRGFLAIYSVLISKLGFMRN